MGQHGDRARQALMDAAEELFGRYGIDAVSNRRITEHAGTANHSAVSYHFGTRDELILALFGRHTAATEALRDQKLAALGGTPDLRAVVECRILALIEVLGALPVPSWRARFLRQAGSVPSVAEALSSRFSASEDVDVLYRQTAMSTGEGSRRVMRARAGIVGHLVLGVCAEYEGRLESDAGEGSWTDVGYFLVDSVVGLLAAPVTRRSSYLPQASVPGLI